VFVSAAVLAWMAFILGRVWELEKDGRRLSGVDQEQLLRQADEESTGSTDVEADREAEKMDAPEISMCRECSALLDDSRDQRNHQGRTIDRCLTCAKHGLCPSDVEGKHQPVWPEDPAYDPAHQRIGPLPVDLRTGYCGLCLGEFLAGDDDFRDLTWEMVGVLWAEHQWDPEKDLALDVRDVVVWDYTANSMGTRVTVSLWDAKRRVTHPVAVQIPFGPSSAMARLLDALHIQPDSGTSIDLDDLKGLPLRIEVNPAGAIVGYYPAAEDGDGD
jgi:hypothetical protein